MVTIGVIGNGFVGKATSILECNGISVIYYDINPDLCKPKETSIANICECDLIFISVPTPMNKDGSCYLNIVNSVVKQIKDYVSLDEKIVIIRSTVPVGTSANLNCYFMPEFLTEKNYLDDFKNNQDWIFGLKGCDKQDVIFKKTITELFNTCYNQNCINSKNIHFVTTGEAEMIKLFRNSFLATKVAFCNEIYQFCNLKKVDYKNVRKLAVLDNRIGESHSYVPGSDGKYGFGGTCFPKDIHSLIYQMEQLDMDSYILQATQNRNENIDRVDKDWEKNKGRSVV